MGFYVYDRFGGQDRYEDDADIDAVVADLLDQLEEDPGDREHTEVSVHHGDWYLAAHASGLMRLGNSARVRARGKPAPPPDLYLRATRKAQVARLLKLMAGGGVEAVRKAGWVPRVELPAAKGDLFR